MNSEDDAPCGVGCPIRRSRDHRSLASPPGFSQRATSFIASQCQGIHQMPFLALERQTAAHRDKTPHKAASHEDTSSDRRNAAPLRRAYPPRSHDKLSLHPSISTPPREFSRNAVFNLLQTPVVEVNGFEPMTSCLQSRRSPN